MASGRPLFPGSTVEDELHLIFRLLGKNTFSSNVNVMFVLLSTFSMRTVDLEL